MMSSKYYLSLLLTGTIILLLSNLSFAQSNTEEKEKEENKMAPEVIIAPEEEVMEEIMEEPMEIKSEPVPGAEVYIEQEIPQNVAPGNNKKQPGEAKKEEENPQPK
ncbi:MAG: hypothetical protein ABIJ16_00690 [Bacteroidota bacterium]